ncbi:MAG: hypothetical protein ACRDJN_09500 [Chloroflexota bacterium]
MRVLFTCVAATGHFHPLVPFARALADSGHQVAFATHGAIAPLVERAGFQHLPAGLDVSSPEIAGLLAEMSMLPPSEQKVFAARRLFSDVLAVPMVTDLLTVMEAWPPDLLVRDIIEIAGCIAAERVGRPHAAVSVIATGLNPQVRASMVEPVDALRAAHGLPPDRELAVLDRYLNLHPFPPSFVDPTHISPAAATHFIRPAPFDRSGDEALPAWIGELPERPTIYATLGTAFNGRADLLAAFLPPSWPVCGTSP